MESESWKKINYASVSELFFESADEFEIPAYQRHYTWGTPLIEELIQDICVHMTSEKKGSPYYLGSLVLAKPRSSKKYEIVDGQQRCITLWLILSVLNENPKPEKLTFSKVRKYATQFLKCLQDKKKDDLKDKKFDESSTKVMLEAYNYLEAIFKSDDVFQAKIKEIFQKKFNCENLKISDFKDFLLKKTLLLKTVLPPNTDVSLYFERMNDRGEQMEATDIVKADLFKKLGTEKNHRVANAIWNACSNMNRFVQSNFKTNPKKEKNDIITREDLFSENWCDFKADAIPWDRDKSLQKNTDSRESIKEYLEAECIDPTGGNHKTEFFTSVTDFAHLLLHTLSIFKQEDIELNTDKLVSVFKKETQDWNDTTVKNFLEALLKCRYLLDTFIIKSMKGEEESWDLWRYDKENSYSLVFDSNQAEYKQIKLLLSALHCSYPNRNYKNWLDCTLRWLFRQSEVDLSVKELKTTLEKQTSEKIPFIRKYRDFLRSLAFLFFADTHMDCLKKWSSGTAQKPSVVACDIESESFKYPSITVYKLNYIDYLIYEKYSKKEGMNLFGLPNSSIKLSSFKYSTSRTSVDHFIPQTPKKGEEELWKLHDELVKEGYMDGLVNLSLMSPNQNSRHLNDKPTTKSTEVTEKNSLKTQILAQKIKTLDKENDPEQLLMGKIPNAWKELQEQFEKLISEDFEKNSDPLLEK